MFGAAQVRVTEPDEDVYETLALLIGLGTVYGVPDTAFESGPFPILLTARIFTLYVVPLVKPKIEIGLEVPLTLIQVDPPLIVY